MKYIKTNHFSVDFFSIEDGYYYGYDEKVVHILGCLWRDCEDIHLTEYTFLVVPVSEFVAGFKERDIEFVEEYMMAVKQYEQDGISEESADFTLKHYFGMEEPKPLEYGDITTETPMGEYHTKY